jgi:hypothetical protein
MMPATRYATHLHVHHCAGTGLTLLVQVVCSKHTHELKEKKRAQLERDIRKKLKLPLRSTGESDPRVEAELQGWQGLAKYANPSFVQISIQAPDQLIVLNENGGCEFKVQVHCAHTGNALQHWQWKPT